MPTMTITRPSDRTHLEDKLHAAAVDYRYCADQLDLAARAISDGRPHVAEEAIRRHVEGLERAFAATQEINEERSDNGE